MKITYCAIALAATIFGRDVVAQTQTPTPTPSDVTPLSSTVRQPAAHIRKKPTPTPIPYRSRPDTSIKFDTYPTLSPTPTPGGAFDPFSDHPGPHPAGSVNRGYNFANGVRVEVMGDHLAITDPGGHRFLMQMQHGAKPPVNMPRSCAKIKHYLFTHDPNSEHWRAVCAWWIWNC